MSHSNLSRRLLIKSSAWAVFLFGMPLLDNILLSKFRHKDRFDVLYDGSKTITVKFRNSNLPLDENFPQQALQWLNIDSYMSLCAVSNVKKISTRVHGNDFIVDIQFTNVRDMKNFVIKYNDLKVSNKAIRQQFGITAETILRV